MVLYCTSTVRRSRTVLISVPCDRIRWESSQSPTLRPPTNSFASTASHHIIVLRTINRVGHLRRYITLQRSSLPLARYSYRFITSHLLIRISIKSNRFILFKMGEEKRRMLLLITKVGVNRSHVQNQRRAEVILQCEGIPYETLDGSDAANRET
jgi:hypothetical protein